MKPVRRIVTSYEITADSDTWWGLRQLLEKGVDREAVRVLKLDDLRRLLTEEMTDQPEVKFDSGARLKPIGPQFAATPEPSAAPKEEP